MKFNDCFALTELPYFEKNEKGQLKLAAGVADNIVDCHTHVGLNYWFAKPVDLDRKDDFIKPFFPLTGNPVDMEVYSAVSFTPENAKIAEKETMRQAFSTNGFAGTHSAANLIDEMDRMGVSRAILLAVELPIAPFSKSNELFLTAAKKYPRLIPFCSVYPYFPGMEKRVRKYQAQGFIGMKLHPPMQLLRANNPGMMRVTDLCGKLDMPVLYHTGASDLAPKFQQDLPDLKHFYEPVEKQPHTTFIFGHGGIHFYKTGIDLLKRFPNCYMELSGQPAVRIREMLDAGLEDRLLYGSDWPYYVFAVPMAKVLVATEDAPAVRKKLLYDNAKKLLAKFKVEV